VPYIIPVNPLFLFLLQQKYVYLYYSYYGDTLFENEMLFAQLQYIAFFVVKVPGVRLINCPGFQAGERNLKRNRLLPNKRKTLTYNEIFPVVATDLGQSQDLVLNTNYLGKK